MKLSAKIDKKSHIFLPPSYIKMRIEQTEIPIAYRNAAVSLRK